MVGKTPQVREIVYNVLDDSGERTVIAKGATTVDVGDTKELFTRTTDLELVTSNTFSNVVNVQSNIISIESYLSQFSGSVYSPLLVTLQRDHADNAERIEVLEEVHLSNSIIVSNNFSNITILQEIVDSNVGRIDGIVADQLSNAVIVSGTFSNVSNIQTELLSNVGRIEDLEADIGAIVNYGDITSLQSTVTDLSDRVTQPIVRIGDNAGDTAGGSSVSIGTGAGRNIGNNSIGIGAQAQFLATAQDGFNTPQTIVINATGQPLAPTRRETLVIAPIQTDDSNTINIMGYNDLTKEVVQSTLLRGIDGNVHATTNISVNNDTILLETNGNGSFGGDIEIAGTLEVGGTSSFTGAMQVDDTLEIADTSSFGGNMTIDANAFVYGQSFAIWKGSAVKIKLHNDGTGSFLSDVDIGGNLEVGGTSSFTGALQVDDTLEIADTSSFGGNMTIDANAFVYGQSFAMYDGTTENIYIRNDGNASFQGHLEVATIDCNTDIDVYGSFRMKDTNESLHAYINKDGESSFAGKMQIQDELIVEGHSSFVGGIKVLSTSSFGGPVIVNNTSSFTGVANFENDISMTGQNFEMIDTDFSKKINISRDGNASFRGHLEVDTIDCNTDIDVFGSFRMKDTNESLYAYINKIGQSSFAGKMQIKNNLDIDGTLDIKTDGVSRITLTPAGVNTSTVDVLGELRLYNNPNSKNIDLKGSDGTGSFGSTVTCGGFILGNATITKSATAAQTYTIPNVANSDFVMTKGDQSISGTKTFNSAITGSMSKTVSPGTDLSGDPYNGSADRTFNVISSTTDNGKIVKRDANGNFSAGTITASGFSGTGVSTTDNGKIVKRDANGNFSAGTITASGFSGTGVSTTANGTVVKRDANGGFSAGTITASGFSGTGVSTTANGTVVKRDANGDFTAGTITASLTGTVSSLSNHDTNDLAEGTSNKYFTTQRVIDALITPGNIRLGYAAGETGQQDYAVAIGLAAGKSGQGDFAVAVGRLAGYLSQGDSTVAIGDTAGETKQGNYSIAIGDTAGSNSQGDYCVAVGERAGQTSQGSYAIALGYRAGQSLQPANSFYTRYASVQGLSGTHYDLFIRTNGEIQKNTSDDRLKHDEKIITGAVKSLSKLRPQEYLKRQNLDANVTPQGWTYEAGLMAQEVYYSAPELRHIVMVPPEAGDIDNYTPPPSDDPTQDPDYSMWGDEFATVDYKQLAPYLVKAVQEIVTELPRSKTTVSNTWGQSISGLVVSANENAHKTNVTPIVTLSNVNMDKKWYGVVSDKTTDTNDYDTLIDTKGDTQIWVTDRGGPLESGDLITTSNIAPGFTQKQSDDIVRNYTVAKVTQDCDFTEPVQRAIKVPKQELSDVTYYRHDASWYTTLDRYEKIPDFKKTVEEEPIYFREDVNEYTIKRYYQGDTEISREKYNTLSEDDRTVKYLNEIDAEKYNTLDAVEKATYSSGTRKLYKVIEYSQSKTQIPQHDEEVIVQELVNVLDENGQIVWEETGETEPVYTLVDHGTYKAALVSCKLI
jgi:hypothetical protein